jgi:predicted HAD superfamily Cof-like phosphohydrolase
MQKQIEAVKLFHETFGITNRSTPTAQLTTEQVLLRYKLMREENEEYLDAAVNNDLIGIADALGDQLYILCGTLLSHGLHGVIEEVFDAIQSSNMSKLDQNGKPIYREDGKVLKGPNYFTPDIKSVLDKHTDLF